MTRRRYIVVFSIAIVAGLASVGMALQWANKKIAGSVTSVVVAARDINAGEKLSADNLRTADWPRNSSVRGTVANLQQLDGRIAGQALVAGEPILEQRLSPQGSRAGLNAMITPGRRAMTVKVNEVVGVAGFAMPGNFVDILVTVNHSYTPPVSRIVLEKIPVLAVAQDHSVRDETKPKLVNAVTLEVTPSEAERLDLARSVGTLSMVLRNQTDIAPGASKGALMADLLQTTASVPSRPVVGDMRKSTPFRVEIIRGLDRKMLVPG